MRLAYSRQCAVLGVLIALTIVGEALLATSTRVAKAELALAIGKTAEIPVFSLFGYRLRLEAETSIPPLSPSVERRLGDLKSGLGNADKHLEVEVSVAHGGTALMQAAPASSFSAGRRWHRFISAAPLPIPVGQATVYVKVVQVSPALVGERIELQVLPPLSFKSCQPGYCWMWWFFVWPWLAVPTIAIWSCVLAYFIWRDRSRRRPAQK